MSKVFVNKKGARRIRGGHLWIYRSDVVRAEAEGGAVVSVYDEARNFVGKAFYSDSSEITLRIFTTKDEVVDRTFWKTRIAEAARRRATKGEEQRTNAQRLIYSEGDLIPSLIVDDYAGVFVVQTLSQGTEKLKETFAEILREEFEPRAIIERNDVKVRQRENLEMKTGVLYGEAPDEIVINQDGVKFYVSPLGGQKTGSFLDQRENHAAMRRHAFGRGLDCFTFNGGFALNLAGACESVLAVDISEDALNLARRNAQLNEISNIRFQTANVFDALRDFEARGEKFDTVVLDPPAFVKSRAVLKSAARGYKEINLRALKLLNKNGVLATCSCSFHMTEDLFLETIEEAARDARRRVHLIEKRAQSADHPVLVGMPETYYLKCFILRAVD
ncbi:MAG TPA: class I SAM-dependent rRNA methyltransferase [Pyrinomonadaceae bacterium]|nr:class I SAM-dependent rRNA methyltransferase [Pyrinomonadaceae bacterium]